MSGDRLRTLAVKNNKVILSPSVSEQSFILLGEGKLTKLLGGIDLYTGRKRQRYRPPSLRKTSNSVRTDLA